MNNRAFTLIEVLVSIALLSIIVIFLYQTLDMTQKSNSFFHSKVNKKEQEIILKKIFFKDIAYSNANIEQKDTSILKVFTTHTIHNSFYNNITYFVSKENNLIRIESKKPFDKNKLNDDFLDEAFVDTIASNIKKFTVAYKGNQYYIYIQFMNENEEILNELMFTVKRMKR